MRMNLLDLFHLGNQEWLSNVLNHQGEIGTVTSFYGSITNFLDHRRYNKAIKALHERVDILELEKTKHR
jgi:hypothetical protein